ncbi:hypothetical protein CBL_02413 [Carabus blaptoides fortunei]
MPHLRIETNLPKSKVPADFTQRTCAVVAKALGKPVNYCVVTIVPDTIMSMGGTTDPCAQTTLMSIGKLGKEQNKSHSEVLFDHINKELGIPPDRMYITYKDAAATDVGFNGTTFHYIFGGS